MTRSRPRTLADELLRPSRHIPDLPTEQLRRVCFPYCLMRLGDGSYILLNREYKPLGVFPDAWVDYDDYPRFAVRITTAQARRLSVRGNDDLECIFLYHDGCTPTSSTKDMAAYCQRLAWLMKLRVIPVRYHATGCGHEWGRPDKRSTEEPGYVTAARDYVRQLQAVRMKRGRR